MRREKLLLFKSGTGLVNSKTVAWIVRRQDLSSAFGKIQDQTAMQKSSLVGKALLQEVEELGLEQQPAWFVGAFLSAFPRHFVEQYEQQKQDLPFHQQA